MDEKTEFQQSFMRFISCTPEDADWAFDQLSGNPVAMDNVNQAMRSYGCAMFAGAAGVGVGYRVGMFTAGAVGASTMNPVVGGIAGIGAGGAAGYASASAVHHLCCQLVQHR